MDLLPNTPQDFRGMVEADLRRAARLIIKVQDECDPQWRFASPTGDWHIVTTLPKGDDRQRLIILRALTTFMVWKQAWGFVLASELNEPDAVYALGVTASETHACLARIRRAPRPWTKHNFGAVEWLPAASVDPVLAALLPRTPRALTPKEVKAMTGWFGKDGKFPAINIATGEVGA